MAALVNVITATTAAAIAAAMHTPLASATQASTRIGYRIQLCLMIQQMSCVQATGYVHNQ